MDSFKLAMEDAINQLDTVTDYLYKQKIKMAYTKLNGVVVVLAGLIDQLYEMNRNSQLKDFDINEIAGKLTEALNAMEAGDNVLLADILKYEIADQLRLIQNSL
ncbi:MAG: hypothetical protein PHF63_02855 [Herbinix sp.]|nr:hypothetical protein [Herbinix sp.]